MKVLILGYEYPPIGGGTGKALQHLLMEWRGDPDLDIEVWTARPPRKTSRHLPEEIHFVELGCWKKTCHYWRTHELGILLWRCWRRSLGDDPLPDVVLVWGGWPLGVLLFGSLSEAPALLALRGSDVPGFNPRTSGWFWKSLSRRIWSRARLLTANSPQLARLARTVSPNANIRIIPNGVDFRNAQYLLEQYQRAEPEEKRWRILSANRLIKRKRVEWLILGVSHLPSTIRKRIEVLVAGDGPEKYRLETMARELAVSDTIRFLGEVPQEKMPDLYLSSHIFVLASEAEGLSNSLLEALSFGLPCLSASPTGFPDIDNAVLPIASDHDISAGILHLIQNPDEYSSVSRVSLEAASNYSWETVAREYKKILIEIGKR